MSSSRLAPALCACLFIAPACGGGSGDDDDHDHDAASTIDADPTAPDADPSAPDADPGSPDAATGCGTAVAPVSDLGGTEGIAIAADGTIYYSQSGGRVGRWQPGETNGTDNWVTLTGAGSTVWGMAISDAGILYVATPGNGGNIWQIDTNAVTPAGTALYPSAGAANGLTLGPDGAIYYGNFAGSGHVYRVTTAGDRTQVTTTTIAQPNGVLFDADGTLLVASYSTGVIHRLTLNASMQETGRAEVVDISPPASGEDGNPDGLARDSQGRLYVTDNSDGDVLRYTLGTADPEILDASAPSAANMAFGRGALDCQDLYVTSGGVMKVIDAGATGVP